MEYKMKCNVCGKVFCYTDEDLKKNATNAGMGALTALGGLASALGGGTIFHTHHLQGQSDRYTDKIVDYNQCPYCHSRSLSVFTGNAEEDVKVVKAVNINTSASTESLLKRVFIFLEDGEWETADAYCEACLDKDPESAKAYLGKLMAELHVKIQGELKNQPKPFDSNANYRKAIRYGDDELRNTLIGYTKYINNRNENTRKDKVLRDAKANMTGNAIADYEEALSLLASIPGWKDADERKSICQSKIAELKAKEEAVRLEREHLAEIERKKAEEEAEAARIKAKKNKKIAAIVVPILVVLIVVAVIISSSVKKSNAYEFALSLVESGQYADAIEHFAALGDYKDSAEQMQLAEAALLEAEQDNAYADAIALLEAGKHGEAYAALEALGDYKDSKELLSSFVYRLVESNGVRYKYNAYGNLVEENHGSWYYYYQYEDNRLVCEGTSGTDWANKKYTYYPNGTVKQTTDGISRDSDGNVMWQTICYNEDGYPETVIHERDNSPKENQTWDLSYTISDSGSITALVCSVKDAGAAETITESFDFGDYEGLVSIEIVANDRMPVRLTFTNKDRTSEEYYFLSFNSYFSSFSMRKDWETTIEYDEHGKIDSETTFYPGSGRKITYHFSYDDQGNVTEKRSNANDNTDKKLYVTTYTYGYVYSPDVV